MSDNNKVEVESCYNFIALISDTCQKDDSVRPDTNTSCAERLGPDTMEVNEIKFLKLHWDFFLNNNTAF